MKTTNGGKKWTKEEEELLKKRWGKANRKSIVRELGRTEAAIQLKASRMGLGFAMEYEGLLSVKQLAASLNVCNKTVGKWVSEKGLPAKTKKFVKRKVTLIDVEQFWEWAKENQDTVNLLKINRGELVPEPEWLDEAIRRRRETTPLKSNRPWTKEEEKRMLYMFYSEGKTQKEIGVELGRSRSSINTRMRDLQRARKMVGMVTTRKKGDVENAYRSS